MATIADIEGSGGGSASYIILEDIFNEHNNLKQAQTFQVIEGTWDVTSVSLMLDRNFTADGSAETGNLTLSIKENSPTGAVLGTSAVERTDIALAAAWKSFTFSGVELSSGNTYCIVLECPYGFYDKPTGVGGQGADLIQWFLDPGEGPYALGMVYGYYDEQGWVSSETHDARAIVYGTAATPAKPTNPSPGHEDTGVEFPTTPLSYTASDDPPADTYDIYFGIKDSELTKIAETQDVTSWRMPYNILNIKDYNPALATGYRSPVAGDVLTHGDDSYTITYVTVGDLINVQYQAKLYAFRTTGPGGKNPGDVLTNGVAPDVENPQAVRVTLNDQWHFHGVVEEIYLPPGTTFEWRVDATNEVGTTTGNTWEFTTQSLKIPKVSYVLISGGSGAGPYDYPPGEEGTDWNWTGENNMVSIRRLVAAANGKIWIEDI